MVVGVSVGILVGLLYLYIVYLFNCETHWFSVLESFTYTKEEIQRQEEKYYKKRGWGTYTETLK